MEATGVYGLSLASYLHGRGWPVAVVNPAHIKGHSRAMGLRSKNDRIDARCIADFSLTRNPRLWTPPPIECDRIRQFLVRREQLKEMVSRETNALESARDSEVIDGCNRMLGHLKQEMNGIDSALKAIVAGTEALQGQAKCLRSVPGIGEGTVPVMISLVGGRPFQHARQSRGLRWPHAA